MKTIIIWVIFLICLFGGLFYSYKTGYEIGKRSIIINPKGTINDLINDMRGVK